MNSDLDKVKAEIHQLMERARAAQTVINAYDQSHVDEVVTALGWAIINEANNQKLSEQAVRDTGLGKVQDKIIKNRRKTLGLLRDLKNAPSVGVIAEFPELGLVEIAKPVGVVAAIVPSTNPAATPTNKTINAIKCRNAIILAPSPKGQDTCQTLINMMHAELDRIGAPRDLVQKLPSPVNKAHTQELMRQADLVVATGSQNNVRAAYTCGTPAVGVGAGNVVSIVDSSADPVAAAQRIVQSKTFDNATSCSSENSLVVIDSIYDNLMEQLLEQGAVMLDNAEKSKLQASLWSDGHLNHHLIAKEAAIIAEAIGLSAQRFSAARVLMVPETGYGPEFPFSGEKLCPVLTVYRARDFDHAKIIATGVMDFQGKGHSLSIHTHSDTNIMDLGLNMPACRIIVNQAHCFATGGSFDNGLPFSLSMGCGTWGKNSISDNMNYRHYMNTTRISRSIPVNEPTLDEIFSRYWNKTGQKP